MLLQLHLDDMSHDEGNESGSGDNSCADTVQWATNSDRNGNLETAIFATIIYKQAYVLY